NYVRATGVDEREHRVGGVRAVDVMSGREIAIPARTTIVAAGCDLGWLEPTGAFGPRAPVALAMNLVIRKRLGGTAAFGVRAAATAADPAGPGVRYLFFV